MPLLYSSVSRGPVTIAEYAAFTGNFSSVAKEFLEKVPSRGRDSVQGCCCACQLLTNIPFTLTGAGQQE